MLYFVDGLVLIVCALVFTAGIVWTLGGGGYDKNPLYRLYRFLTIGYLRICELYAKGCEAVRTIMDRQQRKTFAEQPVFENRSGHTSRARIKESRKIPTGEYTVQRKYNLRIMN